MAKNPADAFARYGLAMALTNEGDAAQADAQFKELLSRNAAYVPAYLMYGQLLVREARNEEATRVLNAGVEQAIKAGDGHARSEMEALLAELG